MRPVFDSAENIGTAHNKYMTVNPLETRKRKPDTKNRKPKTPIESSCTNEASRWSMIGASQSFRLLFDAVRMYVMATGYSHLKSSLVGSFLVPA